MTHHIVPLGKLEYASLMDKLPPACRFVNIEEWKFPHFWLYAPNGEVVIFTPEPIREIEHMQMLGAIE